MANALLIGIEKYPFLHSGKMLVKGINMAFEMDAPCLGKFLDSRLVSSDHLTCPSLERKAIKNGITT